MQHAPALGQETDPDRIRVETYALLAALLRRPPAPELLSALAAIAPSGDHSRRPSALSVAWQSLTEAAGSADLVQLEDDHFELFIGVGRGELMPYASWYLTGALMDKPLAELRADLARLGLARAEGVAEPEDHAAALCETMALLADPDQGLAIDAQKMFFLTHVKSWMPNFFKDVQQSRRSPFYAAVGKLGEAFIEFEKTWLELPA
ncbi:MAG: TorD/DmsD family molecular chaperone [Wenzhouxiangella sp.]